MHILTVVLIKLCTAIACVVVLSNNKNNSILYDKTLFWKESQKTGGARGIQHSPKTNVLGVNAVYLF
jgi:hypothetical protein